MFNTINERIKYFRQLFSYTQTDIAEKLNIKPSTYSQKEREGNIDCDFLLRFSELLGIDPCLILFTDKPLTTDIKKPSFELNNREEDLIKMYRSVTKAKKDIIFKFVYDVFKNK